MIKNTINSLDQFFFRPDPMNSLGIFRLVILIYIFWFRLPIYQNSLYVDCHLPMELLTHPSFVLHILPLPYPLEKTYIPLFMQIFRIVCFFAGVGLFTRISLFVSTLCYLYAGAGASSWSSFNHHNILEVYALVIFTFAPGSSAWSLDYLIKNFIKNNWINFLSSLKGTPKARWGKQCLLLVFIFIYFASGTSKLRHTGIRWMNGNTLAYYLQEKNPVVPSPLAGPSTPTNSFLYVDSSKFKEINIQKQNCRGTSRVERAQAWKDGFGLEYILYNNRRSEKAPIAQIHWLMIILSVMVFTFELFSPLMIIEGMIRNFMLLFSIGMHTGVMLLRGEKFIAYIVVAGLFFGDSIINKGFSRKKNSH